MSNNSTKEKASIPVILCGKLPIVTTPLAQLLLPDIDVIHLIQSPHAATTEIPPLLAGHPTPPSSSVGSNTTRPQNSQRIPRLVIVGGGFSDEELEEMRAPEVVKSVPWLKADPTSLPEGGPPPNPKYPGWSAGEIKRLCREHGLLDGGKVVEGWEGREGELWYY